MTTWTNIIIVCTVSMSEHCYITLLMLESYSMVFQCGLVIAFSTGYTRDGS